MKDKRLKSLEFLSAQFRVEDKRRWAEVYQDGPGPGAHAIFARGPGELSGRAGQGHNLGPWELRPGYGQVTPSAPESLRGFFKVACDDVEAKVANLPPLAAKAWIMIMARVNHRDVEKNGFTYKKDELLTCYTDLIAALSWPEGRRTVRPTIKQARTALGQLKAAGLITVEPVKRTTRADPVKRHWSYLGVRIAVVISGSYAAEKSDEGRPRVADNGAITRKLGLEEVNESSEVLLPPPPLPSPPLGVGKVQTTQPDQDTAEIKALAARLNMPIWALRWMATRKSWSRMFEGLLRNDPITSEILDQQLKIDIIEMASRGGKSGLDETRPAAIN